MSLSHQPITDKGVIDLSLTPIEAHTQLRRGSHGRQRQERDTARAALAALARASMRLLKLS